MITCFIYFKLAVRLSDTLKLILLLDSIGVGGVLASVDKLLGQALSNGLDVAERGLAGTNGDQSNGLVDTTQRRDIDGLAADGTAGTDTGGVFTGTTVDDGINNNLERVLVGEQVDDLEGVLDDADSLKLLTVVAAVHHQGVGETLNDGALGLAETLASVAASGVRKIDRGLDLNVVAEGDVADVDIREAPLAKELNFIGLNKVLGELSESNSLLDLNGLLDFGHVWEISRTGAVMC